jgi:excisionase family DNA binding protein
MTNKKNFLRSKDVAHILDCSPDDVIELVHRGKLTAMKVGRIWKYRMVDVLAYQRRHAANRDAV